MKIHIPTDVTKILDVLNLNGYDGYVVGGCVRDSILGKKPNDWDICTNCSPEKMLDIFKMFKVIPTGLKHGTVTVVINDESYEITTYRIDGEYKDGRHPEKVLFTDSLKEDLKRRDFTINAMAYNHEKGLIDYYGGIDDICNRKIKCVGDPIKRFSEDYLRMLRGIRFSTQLKYTLDYDTYTAIKTLSKKITDISAERIREELNKILMSHKPSEGIQLLHHTNLLEYILPELKMCVGFNVHNPQLDKDIFEHTLNVVDNTEKDLILRLCALFHNVGKCETFILDEDGVGHFDNHNSKSHEIAKKVMKRLKYDNKTIDQVFILIKEYMTIYVNAEDKAIKKLINRVGTNNIDKLFKLQIADINASTKGDISIIEELRNRVQEILNKKEPLSIKDLNISGSDLIDIGVPKGQQIGAILNELLEIILDNPELNKKDKLIEIIKNKLANLSIL